MSHRLEKPIEDPFPAQWGQISENRDDIILADTALDHLVNPGPFPDSNAGDYQARPAEALAAIHQRSRRILDFLASNVAIMLGKPNAASVRAAAQVAEELALLSLIMLAATAIAEQHPGIDDPAPPQAPADAAQHLQTAAIIARAYLHPAWAISYAGTPADWTNPPGIVSKASRITNATDSTTANQKAHKAAPRHSRASEGLQGPQRASASL